MKKLHSAPALIIPALISIAAFFFLSAVQLSAAITVTAPASRTAVKSCAEFSDEVLRDKWNMNERTDLGWWINNTVAQPPSFLANLTFSNGIFSALTTATTGVAGVPADYSDMNISLLDSHILGSVPIGKTGAVYPINADKYTVLVLRMYLGPNAEAASTGIVFWSKNTIYNGISWSNAYNVYNGWYFYYIDIPALGKGGGPDAWSGVVDSLRIDPIYKKDQTVMLDWARLVQKDSALEQTITWAGNSGNVDIYLDNDTSAENGTLGLLVKNVGGTSYRFLTGALATGDYYAVVVPAGTSPLAAARAGVQAYSAGYYHVNDAPVINFTKPSAEGSNEDFATVTFNDPWDMTNPQDVEATVNLLSPQFTLVDYYDLAGTRYTNRPAFKAASVPAYPSTIGDPEVFFLHWVRPSGYPLRGQQRRINADRYHNLVFKMGVSGEWSVNDGSIVRLIWKNVNDTDTNVTDDIVVRHISSNSPYYRQWTMDKIVMDLKMPGILDPTGSPSRTGWTGMMHAFRIDPHEFPDSREFFFESVRLTADWRANTQFTIEWAVADADSSPTVSLYYDTDKTGFDGTLIASNIASSPVKSAGEAGIQAAGSYSWNVSALPAGTYWIYAVASDGTNQTSAYAGGPLIVDHALTPQIVLSKDQLFFNVVKGGPVTSPEKVYLTNAGQGTLSWWVTIPGDNPFLKVTPMSGTGNASFDVSIDPATLAGPGSGFHGTVVVQAANAWNSPQSIDVWGQVYGAGGDAAPFGVLETPADGATVSGSLPITGWVLDDIETTSVQIYRSADPSDPPGAVSPNGLVYVGDGIFVKGARPDVEDYYYLYPRSDRAGWGYMMLTNFLPNQGNGAFTLYAYANDGTGHSTLLGTKTITCNNAQRTQPFGTLDTPVQGGTISGAAYVNFGWALTPQPKMIPTSGSTIGVYIDSVLVGNLGTAPNVYNQYRADVANAFPGLKNSNGAVGAFYIDSTKYLNAVHTLSWVATDDAGSADGIGSRYFEIQNAGAGIAAAARPEGLFAPVDNSGILKLRLVREDERAMPEEADGAPMRPALKQAVLKKAAENGPVEMEVEQMGMLELRFEGEGGTLIGWGAAEAKELPIGSTLDTEKGVFHWMPGPGFYGRHVLHFAVTDGKAKSHPLEVVVNIVPKTYKKVSS